MPEIKIFFEESVEKNASHYFDKAKKSKKKLDGALKALEISKQKLSKLEKKQTKIKPSKPKLEVKHEWYEKFRWFLTSNGLLAIGGRDASTNEIIIKKHTEPGDIVFHTDMAGSPFFILKTNGNPDQPESVLKELADATLSFSKAWKLGLTSGSVFYVSPEQVTKTPKSGEYLPKGSFMINGKTSYLDNGINLAIGLLSDNRIMCAPLESIKAHTTKFYIIKQGDDKVSSIAKLLIKEYNYPDLDYIVRSLPVGGIKIQKQNK